MNACKALCSHRILIAKLDGNINHKINEFLRMSVFLLFPSFHICLEGCASSFLLPTCISLFSFGNLPFYSRRSYCQTSFIPSYNGNMGIFVKEGALPLQNTCRQTGFQYRIYNVCFSMCNFVLFCFFFKICS